MDCLGGFIAAVSFCAWMGRYDGMDANVLMAGMMPFAVPFSARVLVFAEQMFSITVCRLRMIAEVPREVIK